MCVVVFILLEIVKVHVDFCMLETYYTSSLKTKLCINNVNQPPNVHSFFKHKQHCPKIPPLPTLHDSRISHSKTCLSFSLYFLESASVSDWSSSSLVTPTTDPKVAHLWYIIDQFLCFALIVDLIE